MLSVESQRVLLFCYITNNLISGPLGNSEFCFSPISMFETVGVCICDAHVFISTRIRPNFKTLTLNNVKHPLYKSATFSFPLVLLCVAFTNLDSFPEPYLPFLVMNCTDCLGPLICVF